MYTIRRGKMKWERMGRLNNQKKKPNISTRKETIGTEAHGYEQTTADL